MESYESNWFAKLSKSNHGFIFRHSLLLSSSSSPHMLQMSQLPPFGNTHPNPLPTHFHPSLYTIIHTLATVWLQGPDLWPLFAPCAPNQTQSGRHVEDVRKQLIWARDSSVMQITSQSAHDTASLQRLEQLFMCVYISGDKISSRQVAREHTSSARCRLRCSDDIERIFTLICLTCITGALTWLNSE